MQAATLTVSGFGKLPTHGDFVRHNTGGAGVRAFDAWLQRGLYFLQSQRSAAQEAAYDAAPVHGFLFDGGRGAPLLAGVIQPSRDQAGRKFPFVVAQELPAGGAPAVLPARLHTFFEQSAALVRMITAGEVSHRDVAARLEALDAVAPPGPQGETTYRRYLQETSLKAFGEAVWRYFEDSRKYLLFKNLLQVLGPHRGNAAPPLSYGLRFPLERDAPACGACLWMEACGRLLQAPLAAPSCFWPLPNGAALDPALDPAQVDGGAEASLLLFFGTPPHKAVGDVVTAGAPGEGVLDLQAVGREQAALAALSIPEAYGRLLEDETISLHQFLGRL